MLCLIYRFVCSVTSLVVLLQLFDHPLLSFPLFYPIYLRFCLPPHPRVLAICYNLPPRRLPSKCLPPFGEERIELGRLLKKAAMPDRTVIITSLNETWSTPNSMIDLFLESFRVGEGTQRFLDHPVIVATDDKSFERCKSIHKYCYSDNIDDLMWKRAAFLRTVLELGCNFVFTDADIMWLRNPFPQFPSTSGMPTDIAMAADFYTGYSADMRTRGNAGFKHVASNTRTLQFYNYWLFSRTLYPGKNAQAVFDLIKKDRIVRSIGTQIAFLDSAYIGGLCRRPDVKNVCTMQANCCVGIDNKLHDLRLVLEDWKNYTALSVDDKKKNFKWRAPSKCKM